MEDEIKKHTQLTNKNDVKPTKSEVKELINIDHAILDEYFANGYNGVKAVIKLKPHISYGTARAEVSRILKDSDNISYIANKRYELSLEANTTINRLVRNLGLIANATISDYVGLSEQEFKALPFELSYPVKRVTTKVKTFLSSKGGTETETTTTYEIKDSIKAIDMLGKHLGIYEVHNQQKQRTINLEAATPEQLNALLSLFEQQKQINEQTM